MAGYFCIEDQSCIAVYFIWASLGSATVVDVRGGMDADWSTTLLFSKGHRADEHWRVVLSASISPMPAPNASLLRETAPLPWSRAREVWLRENLDGIRQGWVKFIQHSSFPKGPANNADVYWSSHNSPEWSDGHCMQIVKGLEAIMGARARILICWVAFLPLYFLCPSLPNLPCPGNSWASVTVTKTSAVTKSSTQRGLWRAPICPHGPCWPAADTSPHYSHTPATCAMTVIDRTKKKPTTIL